MAFTNISDIDDADFVNLVQQAAMTFSPQSSVPSVTERTYHVMFRPARIREYFEVQRGNTMLCNPHKYNIRLCGVDSTSKSSFSFELCRVTSNSALEYIPYGLIIHKQVIVRGAPNDTVDVRAQFNVESRFFENDSFLVQVKNENNVVLCQTNTFFLEKKKKAPKKQQT